MVLLELRDYSTRSTFSKGVLLPQISKYFDLEHGRASHRVEHMVAEMSRLSNLTSIGRIFTCQRNYHSSQVFSARGKDYIYSTPTSLPSQKIGVQQYSSPTQPSQQFKQDRKFENVLSYIYDNDPPVIRQLAGNENDVLNIIESTDSKDVNTRVFNIMSKVLFGHIRGVKSTSELKNILNSVAMQKYSKLVKKQARFLESNELIQVFKIFNLLRTPGHNPTFQIVQRLLSKQANILTLDQIEYIDFLLEKMDPISYSPLSEALTLALPIVFESQLNMQLVGMTNPKQVIECLSYAVKYKLSGEVLNRFLYIVTKIPLSTMTEQEVFTLMWLLGEINEPVQILDEFLVSLFKYMTKNLSKIDEIRISTLLGKSAKKVLNGYPSWYNEDYVNAACRRLADGYRPELVLTSFKTVSLLKHVNIDIMEAASNIVVKNPSLILNDDRLFLNLLRGLSNSAYKPEKFNILRPILMEHPALVKDLGIQDISQLIDFLALDILPEILARRTFDPDYQDKVNEWVDKRGPIELLIIANAIIHLHPDYDGPRPSKDSIKKWERLLKERKSGLPRTLEPFLLTGLGGENYVLTHVFHRGIFIDHCVVMDDGGYPVPLNNSQPSSLDDIEKPSNSTLVMIKVFGRDAYARNTDRLRGAFNLEAKVLRAFGYPLVEVDFTRWKDFEDYEKIPWLIQKIKEKAERISHDLY